MSYCRWSSDNFKCDLYVYAHCDGGYAVHVAGNKVVTPIFPFLWPRTRSPRFNAFVFKWSRRLQSLSLDWGVRRPLAEAAAGHSFYPPSAQECHDLLLGLRQLGYRFPDTVLEALSEEAIEEAQESLEEESACQPAASPAATTNSHRVLDLEPAPPAVKVSTRGSDDAPPRS